MPQYVESRDPHEDMNMSAFFSSALSDVQATPKGSFTERCAEVGGGVVFSATSGEIQQLEPSKARHLKVSLTSFNDVREVTKNLFNGNDW